MTKLKITVVIPTFRRPKLLIKCLNALTFQTLAKEAFEVIVVSDGPDLPTEELINLRSKSLALKLTLFQTQYKKGPAHARNYGYLNAKSSLIAFTDDDCIPQPGWLSSIVEAYCGEKYIAFSGKTKVPMPTKKTDFALNLAELEKADFITANCACTKQTLIKVGGFDERFEMAWREDSDLEFKLITANIPIKKIPTALVVHPVREVPWGISVIEQKKSIYDALLYKKFPELYSKKVALDMNNYYLIFLAFSLLVAGFYLPIPLISLFSGLVFTLAILSFIIKRLKHSDHSASHIAEIFFTSLIIPFLSIFWRLYGAIKYRVLFI